MVKGRGSVAPLRGILCMIVGGALLTANDAVLKWLTDDYPVGQLMFLRSIFEMVPLSIFVWRAGGINVLVTKSYKEHLLRSGLVVGGTFLFVTGLRFLPLAEAISIAFAGPLFITALASSTLGEKIGWRRWIGAVHGHPTLTRSAGTHRPKIG